MSDISFSFSWWQYALMLLAIYFWPLTGLAVLAALWWWLRRKSWAARIAALLFGLLWVGSAGTRLAAVAAQAKSQADYQTDLRSRQTTLAHDAVVSGIRLPAGTVVTHASGDPNQLAGIDLPAATKIYGVLLVGHADFAYGNLDGSVTLAHDARIGEAFCSASATTRFRSGKLVECRLAQPSRIAGVPCTGTIDLENGVVCALNATYERFGYTWRPGTTVTDYGDLVWFGTGALAPSLRLFSAPLPPNSEVHFNRGAVENITLRANGARFQGCTFSMIMVQGAKIVGMPSGECPLPTPAGSMYVTLPSTAIGPPAHRPT